MTAVRDAGQLVYGVGKISDIFAGCDIDEAFPTKSNVEGINRTIERGGSVLMPAFAIDRTQTLMYVLARLQREGRIPDVPVIVDGQVIGALGVSGVKAEQDAQVAKAGVAALDAD